MVRGEKGFALVITLVVTALLVALLVEFVNEVYVDTSHSHNFVAAQQAGILAESGIDGGVKVLQLSALQRMGDNYSSLLERWAQPLSYDAGEGTISISIEEESGKLNLNNATADNGTPNGYTDLAKRLFTRLKLSTDLADAVMDWRDQNDSPMPGGAERNYYASLKLPYAAKNAYLETVNELALVKGYTPEVMLKLRPLITVYGTANNNAESATMININTAAPDLIAALDEKLTDDLVQRIVDYRKTHVIKSMADLNGIPGIDAVSQVLALKICFSGSVYRIRSEGKVGESVSVAEAVVRMAGGSAPPEVLYWREY